MSVESIFAYLVAIFIVFILPIVIILVCTSFISELLNYFFNIDNFKMKVITSVDKKTIKYNKNNINNIKSVYKWWNQFSNATVAYSVLFLLLRPFKKYIVSNKLLIKYTLFSSKMLGALINIFYLVFFEVFILIKISPYLWNLHKNNTSVITRIMNIAIIIAVIFIIDGSIVLLFK